MYKVYSVNRAAEARNHTRFMDEDETIKMCTENSAKHSEIYDGKTFKPPEPARTDDCPGVIMFSNTDTVSAALAYPEKNVVILNFASFKRPGGMFLRGANAQEESICHKSNLYNILWKFNDSYYKENRICYCNNLYTDRAIYTPGIVMNNGFVNVHNVSVVTCAAPNLRNIEALDYDTYKDVLDQRAKFIRDIIYAHTFDVIILGAWGCGVFRNNPVDVLDSFLQAFYPCKELKGKVIVFAVPGDNDNAGVFKNAPGLYNMMYNIM